jgi:signal transduction histidine kinase
MHFRHRSIRARIFFLILIPLLSLIGLYAFATTITARDAVTLARATDVHNSLADPVGFFVTELEPERLLATVYLAHPTVRGLAALEAQEAATNRSLEGMRTAADSAAARQASPQVKTALAATLQNADGLPTLREEITSHGISRASVQATYAAMIAAGYSAIRQVILQMPDVPLVNQALTVLQITRAEDTLLYSQALLSGDDIARSFPSADHAAFARLVGDYRGVLAEALPELNPTYKSAFQRDLSPRALAGLTTLENAVINSPPDTVPRVSLASYDQAAGAVAGGLGGAGFKDGTLLASALRHEAKPIDLKLIIAGGLGLLAIFVSIIVSLWIGRGMVRQLAELRQGALELANERLPRVVARLSAGEGVNVEAEAPPLTASPDEVGQVRQAFNSVQRTAIEAAVGQARLRAGVSTVFRNLARRSQSLLQQQLTLLDALERRATEPAELNGLFRIDHLTTRMRRHAEGLMVLAGDRPGRTWTEPVPLVDVLRGAVAEVMEYERIRVVAASPGALEGRAVADVIHMIAELAENATTFSPPQTPVRITGSLVAAGYAVEIEDRGLGMPEQIRAEWNAALADPQPLDLAATDQLGLYVAGRLASRHGIRITLRSSPYGGTTVVVLIPPALVVPQDVDGREPAPANARRGKSAGAPTGRHEPRSTDVYSDLSGAPRGHDDNVSDDMGPWRGSEWSGLNAPPASAPRPEERPDWLPGSKAYATEDIPRPRAGTDNDSNGLTDYGLPRRIRQANMAPQLHDSQPPWAADTGGPENGDAGSSAGSSPEEIRHALNAMQRGWERGRGEDTQATGPGDSTAADAGAHFTQDGQWPDPPDDGGTGAPDSQGLGRPE